MRSFPITRKGISRTACCLAMALVLSACGAADIGRQLWDISREFPDVNLLILLDINEDEKEVPEYSLPPILQSVDGQGIETPAQWQDNRPALLAEFAQHIYGETPATFGPVQARSIEFSEHALNGSAVRHQLELDMAGRKAQILLYTPAGATGPVPVFLVLNFRGNHTISKDPEVFLPESWVPIEEEHGVLSHTATEANRGQRAKRYPLEMIIGRGYGLVTAYYADFYPDHSEGRAASVAGQLDRAGSDASWGAIGAWAWGLSRILERPARAASTASRGRANATT